MGQRQFLEVCPTTEENVIGCRLEISFNRQSLPGSQKVNLEQISVVEKPLPFFQVICSPRPTLLLGERILLKSQRLVLQPDDITNDAAPSLEAEATS